MKILLIQPPVQDFYDTDIRLQPLGLCYLKAVLNQKLPEVEVVVRDFHKGCGRKTIALPPALHYLKDYYKHGNESPFSSFNQYFHFGASFEQIANEVSRESPDIVGISSLFTPYYREVLQCARAIKKKNPVKILLGGGHPTSCPELMLEDENVDYVVIGEGERPVVELVQALLTGTSLSTVSGLGYKESGNIRVNSIGENYSFNDLPKPDFSDLLPEDYLYMGKPIAFIQASRGCPHTCSFCSVHLLFGRKYRRRSTQNIIEEIQIRYDQGYRVFDFEDDNLTFNKNAFISLANEILKRFKNRDITFLAMNGISYESLDLEVLDAMQLAGFKRLNLALVTGNQTVLQTINRSHEVKKFFEIIHCAQQFSFDLEVHVILGLPGDSLDNMINTIVTLAKLPVLIGVSVFYLTPGTKIARSFPKMSENDLFRSRSTAMAITSDTCSRENLYTLFIVARIINFIKGLKTCNNQSFEQIRQQNEWQGRVQSGLGILEKLLTENILLANLNDATSVVEKFDAQLFYDVWNKLDHIVTQENKNILMAD